MIITEDIFYTPAEPTAIALGTFDGVHIGHRAVISAAVELAASAREREGEGLLSAVFTFADLPRNAFLPEERRIPALCSPLRRAELIAELGVDIMVCPKFASPLKDMSAEDFINDILICSLRARHIVCGYDHRFGAGGMGDAELLMHICRRAGVGVTIVPPVTYNGRRVSSTDIRAALAEGDTETARNMLGHEI